MPNAAPRPRLTAAQLETHHRIAAQSAHTLANPPRRWRPKEYPDLWRLIQSARVTARSRRRLSARMLFWHEGRRYVARFTSTGRILIEDRHTGAFLASSGHFAI